MLPRWRRPLLGGVLLAGAGVGMLLYLRGLSSRLRLGERRLQGFLLVPSLPVSLYIIMGVIVLLGIGLALLASLLQQRRRAPEIETQREPAALKTPWQLLVSLGVSGLLFCGGVLWFIRYGGHLRQVLERLSEEIRAIQATLGTGTQEMVRQFQSPVVGYTLFVVVVAVYGGLALLGLWVLFESHGGRHPVAVSEKPHVRRVHRAVVAGLRELRLHTEPRQGIIACYARLEHLLEDHGMPVYCHLTPQEYMGAILQDLDLPLDAFAGLVELFELARYSVYPLDETARATAIAHLEALGAHLEGETIRVARV